MTYSVKQILDALSMVKHPKEGKDIVSLGFVQDVNVENNKISFSLKFKAFNDPLKNSIKKAAESALKSRLGSDIETDINIMSDVKINSNVPSPILPGVKNIIAVSSGKGGVGKSTIAVNLAVATAKLGYKVGLIDADIFGPSIPKMFDLENERPMAHKKDGRDLIIPLEKYGVKMLSIGFFVPAEDATVWRGPMASNALKQLMSDADWGEIDYMFIDLPPGTSDIHLTLVQTISVTGVVIVSTPQEVALADAIKGYNMFKGENINVPVLGIVENMAWFTPQELPDNKYYIFGKGGAKKLAEDLGISLLGQIPIVQSIREGGDDGSPSALKDDITGKSFEDLANNVVQKVVDRNENLEPTKKVNVSRH